MKISKKQFVIFLITFLMIGGCIGYVAFAVGRHSASLAIKEVTPKQLAEAMQGDHFYSDYPQTMLLMHGTVESVNHQNRNTVIQFETTTTPNVLPTVSCNMKHMQADITVKETITVLTVAYGALRKNLADVLLQNCYLIK